MKVITQNKKANYDYYIIETYDAGVILIGTEVKSIRRGNVNIKESYCHFEGDELFVHNMNVSQYKFGDNHEVDRVKKLLLTKKELKRLKKNVSIKGNTIIPLKIFLNKSGFIKIQIGLCKGKQEHDKRNSIKLRDIQREINVKVK